MFIRKYILAVYIYHHIPILFSASLLTFLIYSGFFYLNILAASTFAGESVFGSTNIDITLTIMA